MARNQVKRTVREAPNLDPNQNATLQSSQRYFSTRGDDLQEGRIDSKNAGYNRAWDMLDAEADLNASKLELPEILQNAGAEDMQESGVQAVQAASGMTILDGLLDSIEVSDADMCWAACVNGLPVAMFGCNKLQDDVGGIWLLATPAIYENKLDFMRCCKEFLALMHTRYEFLTNFVDKRNLKSMMWLPRLGFLPVQQVEEFGFEKRPFIQYVSKRN